jgi:serine/threonine protein kinase
LFRDRLQLMQRIQRFEVVEHLATGGMGAVYRAHDPQLERDVAIKVLVDANVASELSPDDTIDLRGGGATTRDDLLREARLMAKLSHPNVLPVYEVGLSDGAVFVVMEHIAGEDVEAWLAAERTTPQILDVFAQAGRGLAAAHETGIVHRDFKPANVLVGRDGRVRVADFGLSKLVARSPTAMVQVDDGRGTPRYMAPELWAGKPATARSDVYAFCSALDRALGGVHAEELAVREKRWRERGLSARLRTLLAAGFAEDPEARPSLSALLAALENRRGRSLWIYGAIAGALAAGGVAAALLMHDSKPSCEIDPQRFADGWNAQKRAALLAALKDQKTTSTLTADHIARVVDALEKSHLDELRATCIAVNEDKLGKAEARNRESCIQRKAYELHAVVDRAIAKPRELDDVREVLRNIPAVENCRDMLAAPPKDPAKTKELYTRYITAHELTEQSQQHAAMLEALERDARAAGELEVAADAAFQLVWRYRAQDRLAESDVAAQRAYQDAVTLKWTAMMLDVMLSRSKIAAERGDYKQARDFATTARTLVEDPRFDTLSRARAVAEVARADYKMGEFEASVKHYTEALALLEKAPVRERDFEADIRFQLINSITMVPGGGPRAIEVANETVAFAKRAYGETNANYGVALNMLAGAYQANNDYEHGFEYAKQALANLRATLPQDSSHVILQRGDNVTYMIQLGQLADARTELVAVLDATTKNQATRQSRSGFLMQLGEVTYDLGKHDEGQRLVDQAREEATALMGMEHKYVTQLRQAAIGMQLERGQYDAAESQLRILDEAKHEPRAKAITDGALRPLLLLGRGKPEQAEKLARAASDGFDELKGLDVERLLIMQTHAETLLALKRWADARAVVTDALAIAQRIHWRVDRIATLEVQLARAEVGLGEPEGMQRARRAADELSKWPGQISARREVAALLKSRR